MTERVIDRVHHIADQLREQATEAEKIANADRIYDMVDAGKEVSFEGVDPQGPLRAMI
ncbi:hypothetical protein ACTXG7_16400 [Mycolicibacterium sp. Dal123E01]|uniref:hypothetical protein n=1 Tax=Mycolicibacterium sp. Dal123E01 TaxID=3457578 RepID=UPI00403E9BD6